jgi:hypothetical protein
MEMTGRGFPIPAFLSLVFILLIIPLTPGASAQGFDVSIVETDVTLTPGEPVEGDLVEISADIRNSGDTAEDVTVKFEIDDQTIANEEPNPFDSSVTVSVDWDTTGLDTGIHYLTITLLALDDTNSSNNKVNISVDIKPRPKPFLEIKKVTLDPIEPVEGGLLNVSATISNTGDLEAKNAPVILKVNGTEVFNTTMLFEVGKTKTAMLQWNDTVEGPHTIVVETADDSRQVQVIVQHRSEPVIHVTKIEFSDISPTEGNEITITATIENSGDAGATTSVIFFDDVREIGRKDITIEPGDTKTLKMKYIAKKGKRIIRVEVAGHPDAVRIEKIEVNSLQSRSCGGAGTIVIVGLVLGMFGLVGFVGRRRMKK